MAMFTMFNSYVSHCQRVYIMIMDGSIPRGCMETYKIIYCKIHLLKLASFWRSKLGL